MIEANNLGNTWKVHKEYGLQDEDPELWETLEGVNWGFTVCMPGAPEGERGQTINYFLMRAKLLAQGKVMLLDHPEVGQFPADTAYEVCYWFEHKEDRDRLWQEWINL